MQMKLSAANDHFIAQFVRTFCSLPGARLCTRCTRERCLSMRTHVVSQRTMIQLFMDWRNGVGRGASEKEIKRQWKNNVRVSPLLIELCPVRLFCTLQFLSFLIRMNDGEMSVRVRSFMQRSLTIRRNT